MYIVYLYNHDSPSPSTCFHQMDDHFRFFFQKKHAGILAKSYEHVLSPTPWRFKLLKKTPPNCWGTHATSTSQNSHLNRNPESILGITRFCRILSRQFWKKQLGFKDFFVHPEPWGKLDPFFWRAGIFCSKGFREKTAKTRKQQWEANSGGILSIDSSVFRLRQRSPNRPVTVAKETTRGELGGNPETPLFRNNGVFFPPN